MWIQPQKEHLGKALGERLDVPEADAKALITGGIAQAAPPLWPDQETLPQRLS